MAAPIRSDDDTKDKIAKLLPAELTAAFLSCKAGFVAANLDSAKDGAAGVFWCFVAILFLAPFYIWFVSKIKNALQIGFLCLSFIVFSISIAEIEFASYLGGFEPLKNAGIEKILKFSAIVFPILWAFIITKIFVGIVGDKVENSSAPPKDGAVQ